MHLTFSVSLPVFCLALGGFSEPGQHLQDRTENDFGCFVADNCAGVFLISEGELQHRSRLWHGFYF